MSAAVPTPPARGDSSRSVAVLRAVHAEPGIARAALARALGMSSGLAADTIGRLVAAELLVEGPPAATGSRGRPTRSLGPHPRGPLVIVAAIAHETWEVAAVQLGGAVVERGEARHDRDRPAVLSAVRSALETACARHGRRVRALAVSVPGTVSGTRLVQAPNLGWHDVELAAVRPRGAAQLPFDAGNDATFSALAETRRGAAAGTRSSVHLYMDSGIGGALVDAGHVLPGARGRAGEFGHMPFGRPGAPCRCGARGCWNTALDGAALAHALGRAAPADDVSFSRQVMVAARGGAVAERRAVGDAAAALGRGAAALVNALDPEVVVAGGLAPELLAIAPERVAAAYRAGLMGTLVAHPPAIAPGALGARAPLVGAAEHAFDTVLRGTLI